jgi:phosphatidate cytidylyltransferase
VVAEPVVTASTQLALKPTSSGALAPRILSSVVLIPVALGAVWAGSPWLALLAALAAGGMAWEWVGLIGRRRTTRDSVLAIGCAVAAVLVAGLISEAAGILIGVLGALALAFFQSGPASRRLWMLTGTLWIVLPSIGFVWLRDMGGGGRATILWVLALVWAVDTAAYIAGKSIGGPKLVPRISPKKTWAGLFGGIMGALLVGFVSVWLTDTGHWWQMIILSGLLAVVEQAGDIAESFAKRRFGAKDSSTLIPGHGGLLDRLDGMLAVIAAVAILSLATGSPVLTWH